MSGYMDLTNIDYHLNEHNRRAEKVNRTAWMFETGSGEPKTTPTEHFTELMRRGSLTAAAAVSAVAAIAMFIR